MVSLLSGLCGKLSSIIWARCFNLANFGESVFNILHFADAIEEGYGIVTFLLEKNSINEINCAFLKRKSRMAPLKPVIIPWLELTTAAMAACMDKILILELHLELQKLLFFVTQCNQAEIHPKQSRQIFHFVIRVDTILKILETLQLRYTNTSQNPADSASKPHLVTGPRLSH